MKDEMMERVGYYQEDRIKEILVGRRIVKAELTDLILDNGTILQIVPNDGGCVCGAGDYWLENINKFDNVITNVEVKDNTTEDDSTVYQLFVYSGGVSTSVADIKGDDGNGYYGTGFDIHVKHTASEVKEDKFINIFNKDNHETN